MVSNCPASKRHWSAHCSISFWAVGCPLMKTATATLHRKRHGRNIAIMAYLLSYWLCRCFPSVLQCSSAVMYSSLQCMPQCISWNCGTQMLPSRVLQVTNQGLTALNIACNANIHQAIRLLVQLCPGLIQLPTHHRFVMRSPFCTLVRKRNRDCLRLLNEAGYRCSTVEVNWIHEPNGEKIPIDVIQWIEETVLQPWSLQKVCRTCIRGLLRDRIQYKAHKLPIPQKLIDSVLLKRMAVDQQ